MYNTEITQHLKNNIISSGANILTDVSPLYDSLRIKKIFLGTQFMRWAHEKHQEQNRTETTIRKREKKLI